MYVFIVIFLAPFFFFFFFVFFFFFFFFRFFFSGPISNKNIYSNVFIKNKHNVQSHDVIFFSFCESLIWWLFVDKLNIN